MLKNSSRSIETWHTGMETYAHTLNSLSSLRMKRVSNARVSLPFKKSIRRNNQMEGNMKVDNQVANELLLAVRKGKRLQDFMNAISGVEGYRLNNLNRQGHVRSMFAKELIAEQFLLDFDDIISVFWQGVFEHLDKAKLYDEIVEIKMPGKKHGRRPTKNNPIHYLRYHGRMAVRNYISSLYRKNLEQGCNYCGHKITISNNKICQKCGNVMSTIYKFDNIEDEKHNIIDNQFEKNIENKDIDVRLKIEINKFAEDELKGGTRAYQVLKILTDPDASKDMCKACGLCGLRTFDIDTCTNYNVNIGRWLGVNKTMIASKIRRIRKALPEWLRKRNTDEAHHLVQMIPARFQVLK